MFQFCYFSSDVYLRIVVENHSSWKYRYRIIIYSLLNYKLMMLKTHLKQIDKWNCYKDIK